ncbi:unnamed protein product, partial [Cladocopium goreaui]
PQAVPFSMAETFVSFGQAPTPSSVRAPHSGVQPGAQLPALAQSSTSRCAALSLLGAAAVLSARGSKTARAAKAKAKKKDVVMKKKTKKKKQRFDPANEIGVCAPLGFFDPLGFAPKNKRNNFKNLRAMEIKHGRIAMLATVGSAIFYGPVGFIQLLGGLFGIFIFECALASPAAQTHPSSVGAADFFCGWSETTETLVITGRGGWGRHHGTGIVILGKWEEAGLNPLSIPLDTPEMRLKAKEEDEEEEEKKEKKEKEELNNGRMAMISIAGIWAAELVTKKDSSFPAPGWEDSLFPGAGSRPRRRVSLPAPALLPAPAEAFLLSQCGVEAFFSCWQKDQSALRFNNDTRILEIQGLANENGIGSVLQAVLETATGVACVSLLRGVPSAGSTVKYGKGRFACY